MYLHYYSKLPEPFNDYFLINDSIHSYNTRSASKIHIDFKKNKLWKIFLFRMEEQ